MQRALVIIPYNHRLRRDYTLLIQVRVSFRGRVRVRFKVRIRVTFFGDKRSGKVYSCLRRGL